MRKFFMFLLIPLYLFSISDKDKKVKKSPCAKRCTKCLHVAVLQYGTHEDFRLPLKKCIEAGCSINAQDKNGKTPLHLAVENHYLGVAQFFVHQCQADINAKDNKKMRPLDIIIAHIKKEEQKECKSSKILLVCFRQLLTQRTKTI